MDDSTIVEWMSKVIGQAARSAKFCVVGCLPVADPGIEVESVGAVTLPLKPKMAKVLDRVFRQDDVVAVEQLKPKLRL
jgi:hypothetical protein